jgi:hypothetical protein
MEQPATIAATTQIPLILPETCTSWAAYTAKDVVDQIDSGLKKDTARRWLRWKGEDEELVS